LKNFSKSIWIHIKNNITLQLFLFFGLRERKLGNWKSDKLT
jgi:hypothetical protein